MRVDGIDHIVAIAAGFCTSFALGNDGHVWAWGCGEEGVLGSGATNDQTGQLGDGTTENRHSPVRITSADY